MSIDNPEPKRGWAVATKIAKVNRSAGTCCKC